MECEYSANLSLAIKRTDEACSGLQKALEMKEDDPEASAVLKDTKLIHQQAIVDMLKEKKRHQATCEICRAV